WTDAGILQHFIERSRCARAGRSPGGGFRQVPVEVFSQFRIYPCPIRLLTFSLKTEDKEQQGFHTEPYGNHPFSTLKMQDLEHQADNYNRSSPRDERIDSQFKFTFFCHDRLVINV